MTVTRESFLRDVATHTMKVVKADGVHRHLHFRAASFSSVYYFDVVTWPGCLAITGDAGSYLFSRIRDMFEFFRSDRGRINPSYWAEKVDAADKHGGLKAWDPIGFKRNVISAFRDQWQGCSDYRAMRRCWDELRHEVLDQADDEHEAMTSLRDFSFKAEGRRAIAFDEYWELGSREYTHRFLWNCHAIVWAIQQFDAAQPTAEAA